MNDTVQLTINATTWGVSIDGRTVLNGATKITLEPYTLYFDKYGRRAMPAGNGKFQNPDWLDDKRKPRHLTDEQARTLISRLETPQEIASRAISLVASNIKL